jgi:hypothetical protein
MGPLELDATGPPSPNDHAAWSPPLGSGSWSAPRRRPAQDALRLPVSTCSVPYSPATRPAPWPEPAPVSARWDQGGTAAGTAAKRRPWATSSPRASQPRPTPHHPLPVRTDAGRRPRRPRTTAARRPAAPGRGGPPHRATPGSSARTARRQRRGHRRPVRPDTWMPRTPGHRTRGCWTSARPVGRTSPRRTGRGGQGNDRPGRRPDILATGDTPLGGPTSPGSRRLGALGHPRRLRGDGTCAAALTAAATGQLPSTARHEAAPRRTALVCWSWRVRGEGNGTTER